MDDYRNDIERYLQGKMSPAERHEMERLALDDPFLADALEGAQTISPDDFSTDLGEVRRRLEGNTTQQKKKYTYYAIAASILLLIGIGSVWVLQSLPADDKTAITMNREKAESDEPSAKPGRQELQPTPSQESESPIIDDEIPTPEAEPKSSAPPVAEESESSLFPLNPGIDTSTEAQRQSPADSEETPKEAALSEEVIVISPTVSAGSGARMDLDSSSKETKSAEPVSRDETSAQEEHHQREKKRGFAAPSTSSAPSNTAQRARDMRTVQGTVTDAEDGLPLPGVSVQSGDGTTGTVTDMNGHYDIAVQPDATIMFSFIGMQSREVNAPAGQSTELDVQLVEDVSQLSEVVVTGYGNEEDISMESIRWEYAEPEGGRKAYKEYLENNLRYPEKALESDVEGKVSIQFTIEPSGTLTEFRVVRSLGHGCDEEVMRLIKEGPAWNPTKRDDRPVKSKGKVKMRFALPRNTK